MSNIIFVSRMLRLMLILTVVVLSSCVEEIDFVNDNFESILVVDATITNEEKLQEIILSRTFEFGEVDENPEEGAQVTVMGDGVEYTFQQMQPGIYQSIAPFSAQPNVNYHLQIMTANGDRFSSSEMQLTTATQIDNLYAERVVNDDGIDGVAILVDSFDPTNTSNFYRYTFEETYKIIAPMWVQDDAYVIADEFPNCVVGLENRPDEQRICYATMRSTEINIANTSGLSQGNLVGHTVNFLSNQNYKISHRYSALVYQYVISSEAHDYLETIQSFNSEGSLFSQVQTGFVVGNIVSEINESAKVIGIFEVSSVSHSRVYFNYRDLYPSEQLPPYVTDCNLTAPELIDFLAMRCKALINVINTRSSVYLRDYDGNPAFENAGPYYMITAACGDCTQVGEPEPPSFWVE